MKKRTVVILALISTVLSLLFCLLSYFGFTRYISMHLFSTESYAKKYKSLDKADNKARVVISLTTTPERVTRLKPTLNSLLDQTVQVDEIAITVPYKTKIPNYVKGIAQVYNSADYKDVCSLIPVLMREGEKDTKIIIVYDNIVYGKDFIETLVESSSKNNDKAINVKNGFIFTPEHFNDKVLNYDDTTSLKNWIKQNLKTASNSIKYNESFTRL